jgi:tetratricopeptide (TPR) repeat protein
MRRYAEAEEALREIQRLGHPALVEMARLTWGRDGTTDGYQPLLERDPAGGRAWQIAMTEGRHEDAAAILPNLLEVSIGQNSWVPKALREAETLEALRQREAAREKYQDAATILQPLVEETPDDERYHASLARAYAGLGRRDEAVREGRRAVEIMPRERDAVSGPHFLFDLAAVHARLGEAWTGSGTGCSSRGLVLHVSCIRDHPRFQALLEKYE